MVNHEKPVFLKTLILVIIILLLEAGAFVFFLLPGGISGFSIVNVSGAYSKLYPSSKIFLIVQWGILAILLIFVYFKNIGIHKRNNEATGIHIQSAIKRSKTNLDALYLVLQERKKLNIKTISSVFNITPDLAIEWARILEAGELVTIDYPGIGSPVVIFLEEKKEEKEEVKEKKKVAREEKNLQKSQTIMQNERPEKKEEKVLETTKIPTTGELPKRPGVERKSKSPIIGESSISPKRIQKAEVIPLKNTVPEQVKKVIPKIKKAETVPIKSESPEMVLNDKSMALKKNTVPLVKSKSTENSKVNMRKPSSKKASNKKNLTKKTSHSNKAKKRKKKVKKKKK